MGTTRLSVSKKSSNPACNRHKNFDPPFQLFLAPRGKSCHPRQLPGDLLIRARWSGACLSRRPTLARGRWLAQD
jgi:hypothetical protein